MALALETYREDEPHVGSAISRREGVFLSLIVHAVLVAVWILMTEWSGAPPQASAIEQPRQTVNFVQMVPRVETPAVAKPNVEFSDRDRRATSPTTAVPLNEAPASVGNTIEKTVAPPPEKPAGLDASGGSSGAAAAAALPDLGARLPIEPPPPTPAKPAGSGLGQSIRNLQQYLATQNYNNPQGGAGLQEPSIDFDSKGVELGPWARRFLLQVKRNWFPPQIAMRTCSYIQFFVHKDGRITDIKVVRPSPVDPFNASASSALQRTSPTLPLPTEYPDEKMLITIKFIYNEGCPTT